MLYESKKFLQHKKKKKYKCDKMSKRVGAFLTMTGTPKCCGPTHLVCIDSLMTTSIHRLTILVNLRASLVFAWYKFKFLSRVV